MDVPEPLRQLAAQLDAARAAGDGAAIAALYADDGLLILADGARLQGRAAIAAHYANAPAKGRQAPRPSAAKFYFFPPIAHAVSSASGRHGEKHSLIDIYLRQDEGNYLLQCSSWTWQQP